MATLYRAGHRRFSLSNPEGAAKATGRWHKRGQEVLYFASSLSLAVLELRANGFLFQELREDYHFVRVELDLPNSEVAKVPESVYGSGWRRHRDKTQDFGSIWFAENRSLVLEVRSAVLPPEMNYVVNTQHPHFRRMVFPHPEAIPLDTRL